jgi:hypothetical protein
VRAKLPGKARAIALAFIAFACLGALAQGAVVQRQGLRITVLSQIQPFKLPRDKPAPIAVFISGHIATPSGATPPQLQKMVVEVNRHGLLQSRGLPACTIEEVQPASDERALSQCGDALVGSGRFYASVVFPDQRPYPTRGRLLIFNGKVDGKPVLFAHIYTQIPFATSFVITFSIKHISKGPYGTELSASLPGALGNWGFVDRIKLTLKRKYRFHGKELSYFNAGCPAPKGTKTASFPLARASFQFSEAKEIALTVQKSCGVRPETAVTP